MRKLALGRLVEAMKSLAEYRAVVGIPRPSGAGERP